MKIERCPDYCPFLVKEEFYCQLFDKDLFFENFIIKCEECMNSDVRKTQYKKKVKDFERRQILWDKAVKRQPNKLWQKIKVTFNEWKQRNDIKEFFTLIAKEFSIFIDKKTTRLLINLFMVMDNSERAQLKSLLTNSKTADILVKFIQKKGAQKDILKLVRQKMDQMVFEEQKELQERIRQARQKTRFLER